jgi:hypothetical protein
MMGAVGEAFTVIRGSHVGDNVTVPCLAATLAAREKYVELSDILDGAGIVVLQGEVVNFQSVASGAGTTYITVELSDAVQLVNVRGPRVAGAAAAVAGTPTETLANLRAALSSASRYKLKAIYATSPTIHSIYLRWTKSGQATNQAIPGANALTGGLSTYAKLSSPISGTGAEFNTDFAGDILATAADAAAVQDIFALFETN